MNFDLEYDYAEALKRQGHKQTDVDALRAIVMQHEIIPKSITDKQILLFLDSCGGIDGGAKVMKMYYETRQNSPELFLNRDPQMAKIRQCFENQGLLKLSYHLSLLLFKFSIFCSLLLFTKYS